MAKIERAKNATRNIAFGILLRAYQIVMPFLMRTAMIYLIGVAYYVIRTLVAMESMGVFLLLLALLL